MDPIIQIKDLNFSYSNIPILKNINLSIKKGDFISICGKNGSGKSTLISCLNATIPNLINGNFSGSVNVLGFDTRKDAKQIWNKTATIFQNPDDQIFNEKVYDEVAFGLSNLGYSKAQIKQKVRFALSEVDLLDSIDKPTDSLSFGEKQRVLFACAISRDPEILFLDEPTSNLDFVSTKRIYSILKKLNSKGRTIIMVEHNTDNILLNSNRVILLNNKKLISYSDPKSIFWDIDLEQYGIANPCFFTTLKSMNIGKHKAFELLEKKKEELNVKF